MLLVPVYFFLALLVCISGLTLAFFRYRRNPILRDAISVKHPRWLAFVISCWAAILIPAAIVGLDRSKFGMFVLFLILPAAMGIVSAFLSAIWCLLQLIVALVDQLHSIRPPIEQSDQEVETSMRLAAKGTTIVLLSAAAILIAVVGFTWRAHANHRSIPGHIVRWFRGEGGIAQHLNDLAEDIRNAPELAQLQPWAEQTLEKFREGTLQTNGYAEFYWDDPPAVRLARQERPEFVTRQWGETNLDGMEEPEIFIVFAKDKHPEAVAIGWYEYGIQIGSPEYRLSYESNYYSPYVLAKPGIYVYGNYK